MTTNLRHLNFVPFSLACALITALLLTSGCLSVRVVDPGTAAATPTEEPRVDTPVVAEVLHAREITGIVAGTFHACAIVDKTVKCWGSNDQGEIGDGTTVAATTPKSVVGIGGVGILSDVVQLATRTQNRRTCAVHSDKTVSCWGSGVGTYPTKVDITDVIQLSLGQQHTCALKSDKTVWCWGLNSSKQLGDYAGASSATPVQIKMSAAAGDYLTGVKQLSATYNSNCVILDDSSVKCWGSAQYGALGNNGGVNQAYPVQVLKADLSPLTGVKQIVYSAYGGTEAILLDGTVWSWGCGWGNFGVGNQNNYSTAQQMKGVGGTGYMTGVVSGGNGYFSNCFLTQSGETYCSGGGTNARGETGGGLAATQLYPVQLRNSDNSGPLTGVTQVSSGYGFACALIGTTDVKCWGDDVYGELGSKQVLSGTFLYPIPVATDVAQLSPNGYFDTCITLGSGEARCLGYNAYGELGNNTTTSNSEFVPVLDGSLANLTGVQEVSSVYGMTSCATMLDGSARCWGQGTSGQLGNNAAANSLKAVTVRDETNAGDLLHVASVQPGNGFTCALRTDGTVSCWGSNGSGKLGDGSVIASRNLPGPVKNSANSANLDHVLALAVGSNHTCVLLDNHTVQCWGANSSGQLGDNGAVGTTSSLPVTVKDAAGTGILTNVQEMGAGGDFTCARVSGGSVYCWGANYVGQLAQDTTTVSMLPVRVKDSTGTGYLSGVTKLFVGQSAACAKVTSGQLRCWGSNSYGQLAGGMMSTHNLPVTPYSSPGVPITGVQAVKLNDGTACFLDNDGVLSCAGLQMIPYMGLGIPDTHFSYLPVKVDL